MSTPNPILVAAVPTLVQGLTNIKQAVTTILTGDPAQIGLRVAPAIAILDGQLTLLLPALLNSEEPVVASAATAGLDNLIAKLNALAAAPVSAK